MVGARVNMETITGINEVVEKGLYLTPSEFVRAAIENELARLSNSAKRQR